MRIVFFGSPEIALPSLRALQASRHEIIAVVTQPDKPSGRGLVLKASPVKEAAVAAGVRILQPASAREPGLAEAVSELSPDLSVVVAFGQILPQNVLDIPRLGSLNVHFSLLPKYRGAAPVQWAILNGESETGVTVMKMEAGLDTGPILSQKVVDIGAGEDAPSLLSRLAHIGGALLVDTIERMGSSAIVATPQSNEAATYARMLKKEDGRIDWNRPAAQIRRMLLALGAWPGVHFVRAGMHVKVLDGRPAVGSVREGAVPGQVTRVEKTGITVACGVGEAFVIAELQPAGKKPMDARSFSNGYRIESGEVFN